MWGNHYYDGPGMMGGWIWGLFMLLFWAGFIALIIWAVLRFSKSGAMAAHRPPFTPMQHGTAREILDRRYATGEIDAATYEDMRARLEGSAPVPPEPPSPTDQT
ncbi:SHOCT domain-containing protein [Glycomyces buryatensis]|uniref:SHOCT domain-containing protein n=1 Tax=Glycomyces buryatensis TaxID=2570927 RepID=A0A4S8QD59_9ACTN|nr:SHOCT domain-containing protein [Glycomyces buryatensis]THV41551.1 SHOCT domain-containing protein [Glycomyces buryatensis]